MASGRSPRRMVRRRAHVRRRRDRSRLGFGARVSRLADFRLPARPTPLIGRDAEAALARDELLRPQVRLLTLTGPPGIGKTRLAIAVATEVRDRFEDGARFVDLAAITDPALVVPAIARMLRVREAAPQALMELVKHDLRGKQVLLVLDNFEQVIGAAVELAELLEACPAVKTLVTSRAALRVSWEHELPVPPLSVPDPARLPQADALLQYPAVALFVERARAVNPAFRLTGSTAGVVVKICARLDGLPLAIELAAARIKDLPSQTILERLQSRLEFLTGGTRDLPARQQTLRGAIAWSYELLDPPEKIWFNRLSGFMGGCPLEAVEAVCGSSAHFHVNSVDIVRSLIDKSLLSQDAAADGQPRFRMLETIQEFGLERLRETGEFEAVRERHAAFYLRVAEQAEVGLATPSQPAWLDRLEREHDNLRAALRWAVGRTESETALRLVAALMRFWLMKAYYAEARTWAETVLTATADAPLIRAKVLRGFAHLLWIQGDYERARQLSEQSLMLSQDLGETYGIAFGLGSLGLHAYLKGDLEEAGRWLDQSLRLARELQDKWLVSLVLNILGRTVDRRGDPRLARQYLDEGLHLADGMGDRWLACLLHTSLGVVSLHQREPARAAAHFTAGLHLARDLGDQWGIAWGLEGLAAVAATAGDHERAARLLGAAEGLRKVINTPLTPSERTDLDRTLASVRAALSEENAADAWSKGAAMRPDQAIQYALGVGETLTSETKRPASRGRPPIGSLTRRQQQVAALIARGSSDRKIANALFIAQRTAETHVQHILNRLGFNSRAQIAVWAVEHGLLPPDGNTE